MKTEEGVMIVKNGKGWGSWRDDSGPGSSSGGCWTELEDAVIHDPRFCKHPTDATYRGSPDTWELATAKLVRVRRTISVEILD